MITTTRLLPLTYARCGLRGGTRGRGSEGVLFEWRRSITSAPLPEALLRSSCPDARKDLEAGFAFLPDFITPEEGVIAAKVAEKKLKRSVGPHYEEGHFDGVIHGYRECSVSHWPGGEEEVATMEGILTRIKALFPEEVRWLTPHILELRPGGAIDFHRDNLDASGGVVIGLSLVSPSVLHLRHKDHHDRTMSALLLPHSLYIHSGVCRYEYEHAIPADGPGRMWDGRVIEPARRISLMLRDELGSCIDDPEGRFRGKVGSS